MVYELLLKPFGDQKAIVQQSRPMSKLEIKTKDRVFKRAGTLRRIGSVEVQ